MDEKEFDYINVIPFIDIMLVLLVIVLTTSTFIAQGTIPISLPQATEKEQDALKKLVIEIDKNGAIYLNSLPTSLEGLQGSAGDFPRETPVLIRADRTLVLQVFVEVMSRIKTLGFAKVSLQTEFKP
jgi:biopolymer transport protein ExbD